VNSSAQEPEWLMKLKSVNILRDNRDHIRGIFGKPFLIEEERDFFNLSEGKLVVVYSLGECSPKDLWGKWQVSKDTVIELDFDVNEDINFSSLNLNLTSFKKVIPNDTPDLTIFSNKKLGIKYVRFKKRLSDVNIFPLKSQTLQHCKD
jgi:hypothetical protein